MNHDTQLAHHAEHTEETICPLDCADTCSLKVDIRDDQVVRVRGSKANPFTNGKICSKVAKGMVEWVHGDKRIRTPLRRVGQKGEALFEPISWPQALSTIKQNFDAIAEKYGSQAILPLKYAGPMGVLSVGSMDSRFFNRLGASQLDSAPLCAGVSAAAWKSVLGEVGGIAHAEMADSKLIVIWANNITIGHLHLIKLIRTARNGGAKVVVIDPKRIRIADDADLFLQIKPGTDVVLAYAVANQIRKMGGLDKAFIAENISGAEQFLAEAQNWTLEKASVECGLSEDLIHQFARYWCSLKPASLSIGVAMERNRNGGSAIRAAMALPLLTGNFGPSGAGICDPSSYFDIDRDILKRPDWIKPGTRTINILDVGQHIVEDDLDIPIKALFIYNHNPLAVHPRQALLKRALSDDDVFIVGFDLTMTDSMAFADIVLPACSSMEYGDAYKAYGHTIMQRSAAIIPPVAESRPNTQVFRELAQVFGFDEPEFRESDEQMLAAAITDLPDIGKSVDGSLSENSNSAFRGVKPNAPIGRAMLFNQAEQQRAGLGVPRYQTLKKTGEFTLVSPSSDKRINSTLGGSQANDELYQVEMNQHDANAKGLVNGQKVVLSNDQAQVVLHLFLSDKVKPGLLYVPKGAWLASSHSSLSVNALIPGHKADMADGACYNDTQVDIASAS
ncbi:MAG: anaerobic selenocysteine-containing dehydrogenase [Arenicella sp.]|jgi:anaerobic selenocysteine-containing dehydrogenase